MARNYSISDLEYWDARIREKAEAFGLSCFPQEFEMCDHTQMLNCMAYHGMPSHYPHWSYGKTYERLKTLYDHGVSGLPYEMVINSNPSLAYLMRENSLALQILTIAHVYGHNDFFKNNFTFRFTRPDTLLEQVKARANRIRGYVEDPSIGLERVEAVLDAAHALAMQCRRNPAIRKLTRKEQEAKVIAAAGPPPDPYRRIHKQRTHSEPDLHKEPLEPEEDLLLFIRDHNPRLSSWEKDVLTIADEEARYFIPQIETKIMNEGWATYWHREIMNSLELPPEIHLEFLVRHNQVVQPIPGDINPYHVGLKIWDDIYRRYENPTAEEAEAQVPAGSGREKMYEVREVDRDASFLRRFLTKELVRELGLFEYAPKGDALVVTSVPTEEDWQEIKNTLLKSVGVAGMPTIRIVDADYGRQRALHLRHEHDGRDLDLEFAEKTLGHVYRLWGRQVVLETPINGKRHLLVHDHGGFEITPLR